MQEHNGVKGVAEDIKATTDEAVSNAKDDMKSVVDIQGANQDGVPVKGRSGKTYYFRPCGLEDIPELLTAIDMVDGALKEHQKDLVKAFAKKDGPAIVGMIKVIQLGLLGQDIGGVEIGKEFSLGVIPKIYSTTLDLNDFLEGMSTLYQS